MVQAIGGNGEFGVGVKYDQVGIVVSGDVPFVLVAAC